MTFDEFEATLAREKPRHTSWFSEHDETFPPAGDDEIRAAEAALGARFPAQYIRFLTTYGGGDFCFARILSVNTADDDDIVAFNRTHALPDGFIAFNEDGTGGYYGFTAEDGACSDEIFYLDPDEAGSPAKSYDTLGDFLCAVALGLK
jgi:hypothetical protein